MTPGRPQSERMAQLLIEGSRVAVAVALLLLLAGALALAAGVTDILDPLVHWAFVSVATGLVLRVLEAGRRLPWSGKGRTHPPAEGGPDE